MNYKVLLTVILSFTNPLIAGKIKTVLDNEVESAGRSFYCCENIYKTCKEKNYCSQCDHCACLPHCSFSDDCIALCKDDAANYCPMVKSVDSAVIASIVAVVYPAANISWHFVHAREAREKRAQLDAQKME